MASDAPECQAKIAPITIVLRRLLRHRLYLRLKLSLAPSLAVPQAELMTDQYQHHTSQGDAQRRPSRDSVMYKYSRTVDEERG